MARADLRGRSIDCASKSLHDLLHETSEQYPDEIALACLHQSPDYLSSPAKPRSKDKPWLRWTHAELACAGRALAKRLRANAIQPGTNVAFVAGSGVEYHIVLRACLELRCVFAPMNVNVVEREKEFQHLLSIIDPSVVIAQSVDIATTVDRALPKGCKLRFTLDQAVDGEQGQRAWNNLERYLASKTPQDDWVMRDGADASERDPDDIILLLSTSGTTSLPKGCPLSSRNLVSAAFGMGEVFEIDGASVALNHMPLSHGMSLSSAHIMRMPSPLTFVFPVFGFYFIVHYHIKGGRVVHPSAAFDAASSIRAIIDEKCTDIPGVPAVFSQIRNHPTFQRPPPGQIRHVGTGATRILPGDITDIVDAFGPRMITIGYGLTETGIAMFTTHHAGKQEEKFCVTPSCKIKVCLPETGEIAGPDEAGEIHVGGEGVISSYWLAPQQEVSDPFYTDSHGRWMKTGDQGTMAESGSIFITGRYKELIIRGGENISPVAIEAALLDELKILVEVVGYPDEIAGEVPVAVLKSSASQEASHEHIRQIVLERFGPRWALSNITDITNLGVEDYPRTASGKVQKQTLKGMVQKYLDEQTKASEEPLASQTLQDTLCGTWASLLGIPKTAITSDTKVTQLTDSLIIAKFPSVLRKRLPEMSLTMQDILDNPTISAQAQFLERSGASGKDRSESDYNFDDMHESPRKGPPGTGDIVAAHGDLKRFGEIRVLCEEALKPLGFGWDDVEDIIPAYSYLEHFLRRTRDQANTHRYSWTAKCSAKELRAALEKILEKYATLRSMAIKYDGQFFFVAMKTKSDWFRRVIAGNEEVGKAATVQDFVVKALEDPKLDVVAFPGPLTRFVVADIEETGGAGITITCVHAAFDGVSFPMFVNDLDLASNHSGQSPENIPKRLPYKPWADTYYSLQQSPLAQEAIAFHTTRLLDAGIASASSSLFPPQRADGWFRGSTAGWPPAAFGAERKRLDIDPETPTLLSQACNVPNAPQIKRQHNIETVIIFKTALAILNARRTGTNLAAFTSYQASRSWPFMPKWQNSRMPSAMHVQGPTVQVATNIVPLRHQEKILELLLRLQEEQELLTQYAAAPFGAVHARLNEESPGAGNLAHEIWKRQIFNWLPPWDSPEHLKMERAIVRTDVGLLWRLLALPGGKEVSITVFWDDAQLTYKEAEDMAKEFSVIAETLCETNGLNRTVGDLMQSKI